MSSGGRSSSGDTIVISGCMAAQVTRLLAKSLFALAVGAAAACGSGGSAGPGSGGAGGTASGGVPTVLASGEIGAWAIAVDATNVYWTNQETRAVMKVPVAGGTPMALATGATATQLPYDVAVDLDGVYWNYYDSPGTLMTAPLTGGPPVTLVTQQNGPRSIAVLGGNLYWINLWIFGNNSGAVMTAPLAGGGGPITLASAQDDPNGIAVDGSNVYWTNLGGTVMKVATGGGTPVMLASAQSGPQNIRVDANNVYWTNTGTLENTGSV